MSYVYCYLAIFGSQLSITYIKRGAACCSASKESYTSVSIVLLFKRRVYVISSFCCRGKEIGVRFKLTALPIWLIGEHLGGSLIPPSRRFPSFIPTSLHTLA